VWLLAPVRGARLWARDQIREMAAASTACEDSPTGAAEIRMVGALAGRQGFDPDMQKLSLSTHQRDYGHQEK